MYAVQADHKSPSSAFKLQHVESPLDTLVRKTSLRREDVPRQGPRGIVDSGQPQQSVPFETRPSPLPHIDTRVLGHAESSDTHHSPLLHGHFARDSCATASSKDYNSFLATSSTRSSTEYHYYDTESVYSDVHSSWPVASNHDIMSFRTPPIASASAALDIKPSPCVDRGMNLPVPTVVVSCADADEQESRLHRGRTPITASGTPNFSRPGRPVVPPSGDDKRRVLERNTKRMQESSPLFDNRAAIKLPSSNAGLSHVQSRPFPLSRGGTAPNNQGPMSTSSRSSSRSSSPLATTSPIVVENPQPANSTIPDSKDPQNCATSMMLFTPNATSLPRTPPPRSLSPAASLYSSYSYYPFDGSLPRSTSSSPAPSPAGQQQHIYADPQNTRAPESINEGPQMPQEYLQLGIQCHEANKLEDSARYFEKSANEKGGCGIGMLMWGLTLRHGWGCPKDEKKGFKWLRRAAENAVDDLENARIRGSLDPQAIQVCMYDPDCSSMSAQHQQDGTRPCNL